MHHAVAQKFRIFQRRNHRKNALLLAEFQVGLKANEVVHRPLRILLTQLKHRPRPVPGARITQANRLERAETHRIRPAGSHHLDGHAPLVNATLFVKRMKLCALGVEQRLIKRFIFRFVHRAVDIVVLPAPAIAGLGKSMIQIDTVRADNRRSRVIKTQALSAQGKDIPRKRIGGKRPGRHNRNSLRWDRRHLPMFNLDALMGADFFRD